jgi:nucleotide-binding universal stress UspA family protein
MGMPDSGPISAELQEKALGLHTQKLQSAVETFRQRVEIRSHVLIGVQFLEIIREVLRNGHDLVIKVPESEDWLDHLLGSEDMHLLRKCPCPVWLIKPVSHGAFRRVLAAVDVVDIYPESEAETRTLLNNQIIEIASSLALADFAELHIVHAWQAMGEQILREMLMRKTGFDVDAYVAGVRQERQANLDRLLQTVSRDLGPDVLEYLRPQAHLVKGRARKEIPELAIELKADLVVMGTVARTGIPGFFTGNTAESILSQIGCSVLAIKPPGFQTPVTLT